MWAKAGLKVKLLAQPMASFIAKIQNFDTSAYMLGWGVANFDASYTLHLAGAHQDHRRGRQLQPRPHQRSEAGR